MVNTTSTFRRNARRGAAALVIGGAAAGALATAPANAANNWDAVAECESGGNWSTNTGNGFSGGLQFTPSTWAAYGGQGDPQSASKEQQIQVAERVLAGQGAGAWPVCGQHLGAPAETGNTAAASTEQAAPQAQETQTYQAPAQEQQAPAQPEAQQAPVEQAPVQQAPAQETYQAPVETQAAAPAQTASAGSYTVVAGDTMVKIAAAHGIDWQTLAAANTSVVSDPTLIFPGQVLEIPAA
ncbi:transglycosylase family protein [uncultured Kocuria sp.]|uniref:transglycosylase family protein n=1 Tax=uncultured Kocuria sp. TaxID=259305 RepID=UPI0025937613|nr:transglycosylase family protein [uncultured Kocuria sp.]MCT1366555.1 transglycosylase family protein [Rothia sp. p3-SID1597]